MANSLIGKSIKAIKNPNFLTTLSAYPIRKLSSLATVKQPQSEGPSSSFTFSSDGGNEKKEDIIYVKGPNSNRKRDASFSSVTMPMSFMTGSIVGKRFYKQVMTREANDGNGWMVVLDYRTLKTPSKRPLKLPTLALAKAIVTQPIPVYLVDFSCYLPHPHLQAKLSDFMEHSRLTGEDLRNLSLHLQYNLIYVQTWWCS